MLRLLTIINLEIITRASYYVFSCSDMNKHFVIVIIPYNSMSFFKKMLIMNYYNGSVLDDIIFCGYLKYNY